MMMNDGKYKTHSTPYYIYTFNMTTYDFTFFERTKTPLTCTLNYSSWYGQCQHTLTWPKYIIKDKPTLGCCFDTKYKDLK